MKLFYADTETTGLDPVKNEVFQIAYIVEIDGKLVDEVEIKLRPERPETASPEALKVTGKTLEELSSYPPREEGFKKLIAGLEKHIDRFDRSDKFIWIGQNPDFDVRFVRRLFDEMGDKYYGSWFDPRPADLISLAVACKTKGLIDPPNFKLGSLAECFDIQFEAHDALADVKATREVWKRLSAFLHQPEDPETPEQLGLGLG